ncbi:MAG TPA: asparagine synthase (glutamine-hydrolyzing) [Candidatus Kapabacteria bacterium]|nr:asparagine synthase (glutamine-hydrolyzing) [Candidatus Kapabacteria bacterium]
MCGIVGVVHRKKRVDEAVLGQMLSAVAHRGPESQGVWMSPDQMVALGHRRLAIIDLSPGGHQPMISEQEEYVLTFNGEIYNYQELRTDLTARGWQFKTNSDTEVLLKSYMEWGEECLQKLNGMFAFAIWDKKKETLFAARDPLGEKPFKYYHDEDRFVFASELKAILTDPSIPRVVDWQAVDLAMTYRFTPAPGTGFQNIHKLPAGHKLLWKNGNIRIEPYWQAHSFAEENTTRSLEEWKTLLWETFRASVHGRMIADVPIGVFLSGGLDSSSVVAAMAEITTAKIKTFSVGFKNQPHNETPFAKMVAKRYNTDHTEIFIEPSIIDTLPQLVRQFEEPFFDNAAVPTMAMAKETKKFVTVVLTGDGGDELFGGYTNHPFFAQLRMYHRLPRIVQSTLPFLMQGLARTTRNRRLEKLFYRAELLGHDTVQAYVDYYAIWKKELRHSHFYLTKEDLYTEEMKKAVDVNRAEAYMKTWLGLETIDSYGNMNRAMLADIEGRLGDNYLMKVDFASMLYALENRAPFLDPRLVELALSLPEHYKVHRGVGKWIWKEIVKEKVPTEIIERKKAGFGIPIGSWMRNELYEYVHDHLVRSDSPLYPYFKKECIVRMIDDHKKERADYSNHLWCLLLTDEWLRSFFA